MRVLGALEDDNEAVAHINARDEPRPRGVREMLVEIRRQVLRLDRDDVVMVVAIERALYHLLRQRVAVREVKLRLQRSRERDPQEKDVAPHAYRANEGPPS